MNQPHLAPSTQQQANNPLPDSSSFITAKKAIQQHVDNNPPNNDEQGST